MAIIDEGSGPKALLLAVNVNNPNAEVNASYVIPLAQLQALKAAHDKAVEMQKKADALAKAAEKKLKNSKQHF